MSTSVSEVLDHILKYGVIIALVFIGSVLYSEVKKNGALETQTKVQEESIKFMQEKQNEMNKATEELNKARNDLQGIKAEIRKSIKKAMQDETYKAYRESAVHSESVRVLREANELYRSIGNESGNSSSHR